MKVDMPELEELERLEMIIELSEDRKQVEQAVRDREWIFIQLRRELEE